MESFNFRVWDILNKRMLRWGDIFHLPAWEIFPGTPEQRAYDVMQDTGIKDSEDKKIYRGDIVSFYNYEEYLLEPGIAKIDFDCGGFTITNKYLGTEFLGDLDIDGMCIKVIGNIYENPDLLKGEE